MPQRVEELLCVELGRATGVAWMREYRACPTRRWRIDLALPCQKIAIEIEGQRFHGSAKQRRSDSEKNNYLIASGWRTLRYPASSVLARNRRAAIVEQINRIVCGVFDPDLDPNVLTGEAA